MRFLFNLIVGLSLATTASADWTAQSLSQLVVDRPANEGRVGTMHFKLTNKRGRHRERTALMVHSQRDDAERIGIFFTEPSMIEETAFLSLTHPSLSDENWLYLPATDRVRRLPTSDRGDYFMGTDLTYGDIQDNFKFYPEDWDFSLESDVATSVLVLTGRARSEQIREETGYASFRARIDTDSGFPTWIEYSDASGEPLKTVTVTDIQSIGDAPTAMAFEVHNLQTGHRTEIHFSDMRFVPTLDDDVFDPESLSYGVPDIG